MPAALSLAHHHTFQCSYSLANEDGTRREIVAESKLTNWRPSRTAWTCPGCQPVAGVAGYNIYRGGGRPVFQGQLDTGCGRDLYGYHGHCWTDVLLRCQVHG